MPVPARKPHAEPEDEDTGQSDEQPLPDHLSSLSSEIGNGLGQLPTGRLLPDDSSEFLSRKPLRLRLRLESSLIRMSLLKTDLSSGALAAVELTVEIEPLDFFAEEYETRLQHAIADYLNLPRETVQIVFVGEGSSVILCVVPGDAAPLLPMLVEVLKDKDSEVSRSVEVPLSNVTIFAENIIRDNYGPVYSNVATIATNCRTLVEDGHRQIAKALEDLTKAVHLDGGISSGEKAELIELLEKLSTQATLPPEERADTRLLKKWLAVLLNALAVSDNLVQIWSTWGKPISDFFGL